MAQKIIVFICIQVIIFQTSCAQVLNRLAAPTCACGLDLPYLSLPPSPAPLSYLPPCPSVIYEQPTTIIQDSTVANNLANALQLLVVSNLLSSVLPLDQPAPLYAPLPAPLVTQRAPCGCGCGGINPYTILF